MTIIASYGFLEVRTAGSNVSVSYGGNMGASMKSVKECFEHVYGKKTFDYFLSLADPPQGSPDYMWTAYIARPTFRHFFHPLPKRGTTYKGFLKAKEEEELRLDALLNDLALMRLRETQVAYLERVIDLSVKIAASAKTNLANIEEEACWKFHNAKKAAKKAKRKS